MAQAGAGDAPTPHLGSDLAVSPTRRGNWIRPATLREMATAVDGFRAKYPTVSEDDLRVSLMREAGYSEAECDILLGIAPEETCAQAVSAAPRPF